MYKGYEDIIQYGNYNRRTKRWDYRVFKVLNAKKYRFLDYPKSELFSTFEEAKRYRKERNNLYAKWHGKGIPVFDGDGNEIPYNIARVVRY